MVNGDPITISSVALHKRAAVEMALRQGGSSFAMNLIAAYNTL